MRCFPSPSCVLSSTALIRWESLKRLSSELPASPCTRIVSMSLTSIRSIVEHLSGDGVMYLTLFFGRQHRRSESAGQRRRTEAVGRGRLDPTAHELVEALAGPRNGR